MKVLVVEDNLSLWTNIVRYLSLSDISTDMALDWEDWLNKILNNFYDVVILDINLPKITGLELLEKMRQEKKETPVLILTSNSTKADVIWWLNLWADDYMTKPFDFDELLARLHVLNKRNLKNKSNLIIFWKYSLDLEKTILLKNNEEIKLSNLEFKLLTYLAQNQWKTISRKELYEKVWWEFDWDIMFSKTVDVYIWYLRKKLSYEIIVTIKWQWYKLI